MISQELQDAKRDLFRANIDTVRVFQEFNPEHYIEKGSRYETLTEGIDQLRSELKDHLMKDIFKDKKLKKQVKDVVQAQTYPQKGPEFNYSDED